MEKITMSSKHTDAYMDMVRSLKVNCFEFIKNNGELANRSKFYASAIGMCPFNAQEMYVLNSALFTVNDAKPLFNARELTCLLGFDHIKANGKILMVKTDVSYQIYVGAKVLEDYDFEGDGFHYVKDLTSGEMYFQVSTTIAPLTMFEVFDLIETCKEIGKPYYLSVCKTYSTIVKVNASSVEDAMHIVEQYDMASKLFNECDCDGISIKGYHPHNTDDYVYEIK